MVTTLAKDREAVTVIRGAVQVDPRLRAAYLYLCGSDDPYALRADRTC
jgi:hypothetical protein